MTEFQRVGVTRKNIRCCRPFPDSLLKQPNLMNSCKRESNKSLSSPETCYRVDVLDVQNQAFDSPDQGQQDCQCRSNPSSAPEASESSPFWLNSLGAAPPLQTPLPEQLRTKPDMRYFKRWTAKLFCSAKRNLKNLCSPWSPHESPGSVCTGAPGSACSGWGGAEAAGWRHSGGCSRPSAAQSPCTDPPASGTTCTPSPAPAELPTACAGPSSGAVGQVYVWRTLMI